jgi:Domain of unknown function (DUF4124)
MKSMRSCCLFAALVLGLCSILVPATAHAQAGGGIYMCVDENGGRTITNVRSEMKGRKCERQVEPVVAPSAPRSASKGTNSASPADFPKVDANTQRSRDDLRRKVLNDELAKEQDLLAKATQDLNEARTPRTGEDKSSQRYIQRVSDAEKEQQRHRQNVDSIQREIGTLK